jgi:hypothetical protein
MLKLTRSLTIFLVLFGLAACTSPSPGEKTSADSCPLTEPVWIKPPVDAAVPDPPGYGYYFVNEDSSIMASAWWTGQAETFLHAGNQGIKVGWFRPAGAALEITGRRLDGEAPPLQAEAACCYPTGFQASGLYFPTEGCWEVIARADDRELSFVVWVEPK